MSQGKCEDCGKIDLDLLMNTSPVPVCWECGMLRSLRSPRVYEAKPAPLEKKYKRMCDRCNEVELEVRAPPESEVFIMCRGCGEKRRQEDEALRLAAETKRKLALERQSKTCDWCKQLIPNAVPNLAPRKVCSKCYEAIPILHLSPTPSAI